LDCNLIGFTFGIGQESFALGIGDSLGNVFFSLGSKHVLGEISGHLWVGFGVIEQFTEVFVVLSVIDALQSFFINFKTLIFDCIDNLGRSEALCNGSGHGGFSCSPLRWQ